MQTISIMDKEKIIECFCPRVGGPLFTYAQKDTKKPKSRWKFDRGGGGYPLYSVSEYLSTGIMSDRRSTVLNRNLGLTIC